MPYRTPPALAVQAYSANAFDKSMAAVRHHPDLTLATRAVHAACVSLNNQGRLGKVTQADIAEWAGVGLRSVVRAFKQLVAAGFVRVTRRGLGLPNLYELIGAGSAKWARPQMPGGRTARSWSPRPGKERGKEPGRYGTPGRISDPRWLGTWT